MWQLCLCDSGGWCLYSWRGGMGLCDNKSWSLWVGNKRSIRLRRSYLEGVSNCNSLFLFGETKCLKIFCLMKFLCFLHKLTIFLLVFFSLLRYSSIFRKQFRLSSRWQSSTLAQIPSGPHRDGRPHCCSIASPPQRPLQHTDPFAQSQLESLPSSFKSFQLSLATPRLSDSLQTPQQNPHRFVTEFNTGPPLGKEENSLENAGFVPPCFRPLSRPTAPFSSLMFWRIQFLSVLFLPTPRCNAIAGSLPSFFYCKSFCWSSIWVTLLNVF